VPIAVRQPIPIRIAVLFSGGSSLTGKRDSLAI
jgi:hypothetical protein